MPTNESEDIRKSMKNYETVIRDLIRSITNNTDNSGQKYMKIKYNLDFVNLPPKKTLELQNMVNSSLMNHWFC